MYTARVDRRMLKLLRDAQRRKIARQAANIWHDLSPEAKGDMLLYKLYGSEDTK